jgi:TRAP-type C4-dicarboxylate transport system permease small subunit
MIGNLIIVFTFLSLIYVSYTFAIYSSFQKTGVLRIPLSTIFFPFIYFLLSILGYTALELIEDFKVVRKIYPDSEDHLKNIQLEETEKKDTL